MSTLSTWILGAVMGLISLMGLIMASAAVDRAFYYTGLLFFAFGVLFIFALIGRSGGGGEGESE